ncbi:hypothetical protein TSOC_014693, partial [Tetrabaena socialis]
MSPSNACGGDLFGTGQLLLCSISEAAISQARRASHALASTRSTGVATSLSRPCESGRRLPMAWALQSASSSQLSGDSAFQIAPRRISQPSRVIRQFLSTHSREAAAKSMARAEAAVKALQSHVLARLGFLVRAQQAVRQQLDRTSHWRPFRRARTQGGEDSPRFTPGTARAARQALRWSEQGIAHERDQQLEEAIACYEKATQAYPAKAEYWARLSKALSDCSYIRGMSTDRQKELHRRAIDVGMQAVAADPTSAYGFVACCVSRGRLALYLDNRTKVQFARQAQDDVRRALELEPSNDVAHHLLGRWVRDGGAGWAGLWGE